MKVFTFTTGGCRDGIYLERLSTTKEGVKQLIEDDFKYYNSDDAVYIRDIAIVDDIITVIFYDEDLRGDYDKVYYLVSFEVV